MKKTVIGACCWLANFALNIIERSLSVLRSMRLCELFWILSVPCWKHVLVHPWQVKRQLETCMSWTIQSYIQCTMKASASILPAPGSVALCSEGLFCILRNLRSLLEPQHRGEIMIALDRSTTKATTKRNAANPGPSIGWNENNWHYIIFILKRSFTVSSRLRHITVLSGTSTVLGSNAIRIGQTSTHRTQRKRNDCKASEEKWIGNFELRILVESSISGVQVVSAHVKFSS